MLPLFLSAPANPLLPSKPPHPLHRPRRSSRLPPTNSLNHHSTLAALTSLTLTLSSLPPTPPPPLTISPSPSPTPALTVSPQLPQTPSTPTLHTPIAIIGVAHAPIHQYAPPSRPNPPQPQHHHLNDDDARHEFFLAARLVTAVLLGVMVGIEPRATPLNLGVRSITLIALTAALCTVVTTTALAIPTTVTPCTPATPLALVVSTGLVTGLATCIAASLRKRPVHAARPMSMLVGIVTIMGAACGAGLSLLGAVAYLTALAVMRRTERPYQTPVAREVHVRREGVQDDMSRMVLRIAQRHGGGTRVVEVGTRDWRDSPPLGGAAGGPTMEDTV